MPSLTPKKTLDLAEREFGTQHKTYGILLNTLAGLYESLGRYDKAEPLYKRSLTIAKKTHGPNHPNVAAGLNNLAQLYRAQGRYNRTEPLYRRSLAIIEKVFGPNHPNASIILNNLAELYQMQRRYKKAEPLYLRSLANLKNALGADHPQVGTVLNNLARLYMVQGRYKKAKPLFQRDLAIMEKALGPNHPRLSTSLNNLASLYQTQRDYKRAEPLFQRSLTIMQKTLGADHPRVSTNLNNLAGLHFVQSNWRQAAEHWRGATGLLTRRARRGDSIGRGVTGKKKSEVAQNDWYFRNLVKSVYRDDHTDKTGREMFQTAQWAIESQAAGALAQMSARQSAGSGELAKMVRERQDGVTAWQNSEKRMNALRGAGKSDKKLEAQMARLDRRIGEIDKRLAKDFPDYAALASPKPLTIKQLQKLLGSDEALVLLLDTPKWNPTPAETFIWAVTRDRFVWETRGAWWHRFARQDCAFAQGAGSINGDKVRGALK